ncbi:MAG: GcrA family cell cycle regulator [Acetobacteraceae bacterium]
MEWAEETIVRLRTLWDEGLSTAEIGRRLGVSKNAVVGKAHRLDLPARPSPIRRDGSGGGAPRRSAPRRVAGPTLPPLSSTGLIAAAGGASSMSHMAVLAPRPVSVPPPVRVAPPAPRPYGRIVTCCWPLGEPGTRTFRFCDDASEPGKPYCADHAKLAYVKVRDRREDAA